MTHSEQRFFDYCAARGYTTDYISPEPNVRRTADFRVRGSGAAAIVEVEELTANEDDLREHQALIANGFCSGGGIVGSRARKHIRDAADQLKSHRAEALPSVVVLYDNIRIDGARPCFPYVDLQSFHIDAALYGFIQATVTLSDESNQCSKPDRAGGSRTTTKSEKRYVSAVCVLYDISGLFMVTYHNFFAEHPLPVTMFCGPRDAHFAKPTNPDLCPGIWQEI